MNVSITATTGHISAVVVAFAVVGLVRSIVTLISRFRKAQPWRIWASKTGCPAPRSQFAAAYFSRVS